MILVDAGPLIALVDGNDPNGKRCREAAREVRTPLLTVWPVLAEAFHLLVPVKNGAETLWALLESAGVEIAALDWTDSVRMRQLMRKYSDLPMDLADAALVRVAERERIDTVFTLDRRDFSIYRPEGISRLKLVP